MFPAVWRRKSPQPIFRHRHCNTGGSLRPAAARFPSIDAGAQSAGSVQIRPELTGSRVTFLEYLFRQAAAIC